LLFFHPRYCSFFSFSSAFLIPQASCQALHLRMRLETNLFNFSMLVREVCGAVQRR
jgi:hypothetical protein